MELYKTTKGRQPLNLCSKELDKTTKSRQSLNLCTKELDKTTKGKQPFKLCYKSLEKTVFLIFVTETISKTDEGHCQPRLKYIFNKCGTNIYFFTFVPSPAPILNKKDFNRQPLNLCSNGLKKTIKVDNL